MDELLGLVKQSVQKHTSQQGQGSFDSSALLSHITDLFGQHRQSNASGNANVRPASADPYGDPASSSGDRVPGNVRPASEDPYGDPADEPSRH